MLSLCHHKKSKPMKPTSHTSSNSTVEYHVCTMSSTGYIFDNFIISDFWIDMKI